MSSVIIPAVKIKYFHHVTREASPFARAATDAPLVAVVSRDAAMFPDNDLTFRQRQFLFGRSQSQSLLNHTDSVN